MKIAKTLAGLVAVTSFALLAACGGGKDDAGAAGATGTAGAASGAASTATSAKTAGAAGQFTAALNRTSGVTHKFSVTFDEGTFAGSVDPAGHATIGKIRIPNEGTELVIDSLITDTAYYVKLSGLPLPGLDGSKWQKIDPKKITAKTLVSFGETHDPTGLKVIAGDVATVESTDGKQFKGTLDFTRKVWGPIDNGAVEKLGTAAKAVPFEATVDDKGNLTSLKVKQPAAGSDKATEISATYSDFGAPVAATPPAAAAVTDAPEIVYTLLNSE